MDAVRRRAGAWLFAVALVVFAADRLTKSWAEHSLPGHPIDVLKGVLTFRYATNAGGAFSLGTNAPLGFAAATLLICGAIVATSFRHARVLPAAALGFVLGGGIGNLTDRFLRGPHLTGRVVDFVDLHVWPIFNVADSAIVVGALLLALTAWHRDTSKDGKVADGA
ncbi:MAG: signal peptidase [Actinomycetota bacterium]|nr:signal peptidase [Actinomycetota bacterium]